MSFNFSFFQKASTPREKRLNRCIEILMLMYLGIFMIPESLWRYTGIKVPDEPLYSIFTFVVTDTLKNVSFPISTYIFWVLAPFHMLGLFVLLLAKLWPSPEFEKCMIRCEGKNIFGACCFALLCVFMPYFDPDHSGRAFRGLSPFHYKLTFIALYSGIPIILPLVLAMFILDFRGRFRQFLKRS